MKKKGILAALLLSLSMMLSACGGISEADIQTLVQGNLDEIYLDKADSSYLKLVDITEEEAHQVYEDGLDTEVEVFMNYFEIEEETDEVKEEIKDLYREIYQHSTFRVGEAEKQEDGSFVVPVEVDPLDIFEQMTQADVNDALTEALSAYTVEEQAAMSDEEFEMIWTDVILSVCYDKLPTMTTMDTVNIDVEVKQDTDKLYCITDDSLSEVDLYIISYPQ